MGDPSPTLPLCWNVQHILLGPPSLRLQLQIIKISLFLTSLPVSPDLAVHDAHASCLSRPRCPDPAAILAPFSRPDPPHIRPDERWPCDQMTRTDVSVFGTWKVASIIYSLFSVTFFYFHFSLVFPRRRRYQPHASTALVLVVSGKVTAGRSIHSIA